MRSEIDAVAFDLDGTLYPNYRFYIRLVPFILRHHRLMLAMGKARKIIRDPLLTDPSGISVPPPGYFYDLQARFMAAYLKKDSGLVKEWTEKFIYRGWEELFRKIKLFPQVKETLARLREGGLKLALLSDFPPKQKLDYLGISGFWDTVICSEDTGRLKPDIVPFRVLAEELALPPGRILYVGNSVSYDIIGARKAGMKAALVSSPLQKNRRHNGNADFIFTGYRQLTDYVLH
jgi:putative hydrolase of the HAD superfamily